MKNEQIFLSKNFTIIESPIKFTLRFNVRDSSAQSAEDTIYFKDGWYIFDNNKLLPYIVDGVSNSPKYNAFIEYDDTQLREGDEVKIYTVWVNPKSIESLNSDVIEVKREQYQDITDRLNVLVLGQLQVAQSIMGAKAVSLSEVNDSLDGIVNTLDLGLHDVSDTIGKSIVFHSQIDDVTKLYGRRFLSAYFYLVSGSNMILVGNINREIGLVFGEGTVTVVGQHNHNGSASLNISTESLAGRTLYFVGREASAFV